MKTNKLLLAILLLVLSVSIYAAEPVVLKNVRMTEFGKQVEQTIYVDNMVDKKILSDYNDEGQLTERTVYRWVAFKGWMPATKLNYNYGFANELATVSHTTWNNNAEAWSENANTANYSTTGDGSILLAEDKK